MLLSLVVYATFTPRWTSTCGSFTMTRMGVAIGKDVPLLVSRETGKIDVLDKILGFVGDQSEEKDVIWKLGLGASRPLDWQKKRRFESYPGDHGPPRRVKLLGTNIIYHKMCEERRRTMHF